MMGTLLQREFQAPGAYSSRYSRRKNWRADLSVVKAIATVVPVSQSILDVGAGGGAYVRSLRELGYAVRGVDGTPDIEAQTAGLIQWCNIAGEVQCLPERSDWVICLEVGEHVPPQFEDAFLRNVVLLSRNGLILSWATPGMRGRGHVNSHTPEYVAFRIGRWSRLKLNEQSTLAARKLVSRNYRSRLMVFTDGGYECA